MKSELNELIAKAQAVFDAMTPTEQAHHRELQRRSWVRGELMLEYPEMTIEQANAIIDKSTGIPSVSGEGHIGVI